MKYLKGHTNTIYALAFSADGRHLLTGSGDETARLWDLETGSEIARCESERLLVYQALFVPNRDPPEVLFGTSNHIWAWETATGRKTLFSPDGAVNALVFQPDGAALVGVGGRGGEGIRRWRPTSWELIDHWPVSEPQTRCLAFSADGTRLATAGAERVFLWDGTGKQIGTLAPAPGIGRAAFVGRSPLLVTASDLTLTVWDTAARVALATHRHKGKHYKGIAVSPDGKLLATANKDLTVRLFRLPELVEQAAFAWKIGPVMSVAFSPDGCRCAAGGQSGKVVVWDVDA